MEIHDHVLNFEPSDVCEYILLFEGLFSGNFRGTSTCPESIDVAESRIENEINDLCRYISAVTGESISDIRRDAIIKREYPDDRYMKEHGLEEKDLESTDIDYTFIYNNPKCKFPILYATYESDRHYDHEGRSALQFRYVLNGWPRCCDLRMNNELKMVSRYSRPITLDTVKSWVMEHRKVTIETMEHKMKGLNRLVKEGEKAKRKLAVMDLDYQKLMSNENLIDVGSVLGKWNHMSCCRTELTDFSRFIS